MNSGSIFDKWQRVEPFHIFHTIFADDFRQNFVGIENKKIDKPIEEKSRL